MVKPKRDVMIKNLVMIKKLVIGNEKTEKIVVIEAVVVEITLYGISITLAFNYKIVTNTISNYRLAIFLQ